MEREPPIFLIGVGRTGSTAIYRALAVHEDLGWFSNYSVHFPRTLLVVALQRLYRVPGFRKVIWGDQRQGHHPWLSRVDRYLPRPDEVYPLWARLCGEKFRRDYLIDVKATPAERHKTRRAVRWALRLQGKSRFIAKITGPARMGYLDSVFPDAVFVHVIRDGRAVVNSLLNIPFWKEGGGHERPWWKNGLPEGWEAEWERFGRSPAALAAIQWRTIMDVTRREKEQLSPGRYFEIRYEDFINAPVETMRRVAADCGLRPSAKLDDYVGRPGRYRDMNLKWVKRFSSEEIDDLHQIMGEWLERSGYACQVPEVKRQA